MCHGNMPYKPKFPGAVAFPETVIVPEDDSRGKKTIMTGSCVRITAIIEVQPAPTPSIRISFLNITTTAIIRPSMEEAAPRITDTLNGLIENAVKPLSHRFRSFRKL